MEKIIFKTVAELTSLLLHTDLGNEGGFAEASIGKMTDEIHERLKEKPGLDENEYDKIFTRVWAEELLKKYEYMYVKRDNNLYGSLNGKEVLVLDGSELKFIFEDAQGFVAGKR